MVSPLISGSLPSPARLVGLTTIHHPPTQPFSFPSPSIVGPDGALKPALNVVDVEYAVYYPAAEEKREWFGRGSGVGWIPNPVHAVLAGYMRFAGQRHSLIGKISYPLLRAIAGRVTIPARELAPLDSSASARPLIIFSHGLAGTRHTYSSFCSSLAAQGYVVLAIEHKDGSGPAVTIRGGSEKPEILEYINKDEVDWSPEPTPSTPMALRGKQLELRLRETYEAYHGFRRLINGESVDGLGVVGDHKPNAAQSWLESLRGKVRVDEDVVGIGHSFGGATMLHLLQSPSPSPGHLPTIPLRACVALDPWMEPVPQPAPNSKPPKIPTMIINSDGFTVWTSHFVSLYKLAERANASLLSIVGCDHFPMLIPPSPAFAISLLDTIHNLTTAFLDGKLNDTKEVQGKTPDNGRLEVIGGGADGKRRLKGEKGDVVVHRLGVSPSP